MSQNQHPYRVRTTSSSTTRKSHRSDATVDDFAADIEHLRRDPEWLTGLARLDLLNEAQAVGLDVADLMQERKPNVQTSTEIPISLAEFNSPTPAARGFYSGQTKFAPRTDTPAVGWHGNAARVFELKVQSIFSTRTERYTKTSILEDELAALEQMRNQLDTLIDRRRSELAGLENTPCSPGMSCSCGRVFENELDFANHFTLTSGPNLKNLGNCPVADRN